MKIERFNESINDNPRDILLDEIRKLFSFLCTYFNVLNHYKEDDQPGIEQKIDEIIQKLEELKHIDVANKYNL